MIKKYKVFFAIIFLALTLLLISYDNLTIDKRNMEKINQYRESYESALAEYNTVCSKLIAQEAVYMSITELEAERDFIDKITVRCYSAEELQEYFKLSNREIRRARRIIRQHGSISLCNPPI